MLGAQALERRDHFLLAHLHRIGDHTRGLFEADASVIVSAPHALKDVKVFFFVRHADPRNQPPAASRWPMNLNDQLRTYSREPDFLRRDGLGCRLRYPVAIHFNANARENAPRFGRPNHLKDNERVLGHQADRRIAMHRCMK